jgi:hypothetical protein
MSDLDDKEFAKFLKRIKAPADTPRDMFLSFPLENDNFRDAYTDLENGAEMYARLYNLDQFTVWNHVAKELEVIKKKIQQGFIDKPMTYSPITKESEEA